MPIKQLIYRSTNYPTPEKAEEIADNLSAIDGNIYTVYYELDDSDKPIFYFDNSEEVT